MGIKYEFEPKFVFHNIFLPYLFLFDKKFDVKKGVKARGGGPPIFWGPKTSKAHMKVLHHTVSALFTVC